MFFILRSIQLTIERGYHSFIITNKWLRSKYGEEIRKYLIEFKIRKVIDLSGVRVFVGAQIDTMIYVIQKQKPGYENLIFYNHPSNIELMETGGYLVKQSSLKQEVWDFLSSEKENIKKKIEKVGKPLKDWNVKIYRGILTGFNEAFIIDTGTRNRILANCKTEEERKRTEEIIKPVLRGRDIGRYYYKWAGLWMILANRGIDIHYYNCILEHLNSFKESLEKRAGNQKWYELQASPSKEKINLLLMDKIGYSDIGFRFGYIPQEFVGLNTVYFIIPNKHISDRKRVLSYLLGLLNSRLIKFYYYSTAQVLSNKTTRGFSIYIETLPIPPITQQNQPIADQIVKLVDQILSIKKQNPDEDTSHLEKQIDQLVYKLYDLTEEEIKIIESS